MDEIINPFAPGAGSPPPELAGRESILQEAEIALGRVKRGRHQKSQMLLGLRGVGKTVLLNRIRHMAMDQGYQAALIEAPDDRYLQDLLVPEIRRILQRISGVQAAKRKVHEAMRALRSFASAFNISYAGVGVSVDPAPGMADSGDLAFDLQDLFTSVGEAAAAANCGVAILIDEVQYLNKEELGALITALHRASQDQLPIIFFGGGLPQIAALAGEAKSYAERLFDFPEVGQLSEIDAKAALREPIEREGAAIEEDALDWIVHSTEGYPYFIQEWGFQAWNLAEESPITVVDAKSAADRALTRLDSGFFRVRLDRLTPREREYARAMAALGPGPQRSSDIAKKLNEAPQAVAPFRSNLIRKGMVYSPAYGDTAFTVPMFDAFLRRSIPDFP
ncbi:MAG: AAA family ATPase [Alphaproteobacteria bacterium]